MALHQTDELLAVKAKRGDLAARDELVERYRKWVLSTVYKLRSPAMPAEDLAQHGMIGLLQAISTFDIRRGTRFRTHATSRVRGAALDACRSPGCSLIRVPRKARADGAAYVDVGRLPQRARDDGDTVDQDPAAPVDPLPSAALDSLRPYLGSCSQTERLLLISYYCQGLTMREIGQAAGLSESRISQMHTAILARLRHMSREMRR